MTEHNDKSTCAVCRQVRLYLLIAGPLLFAIWSNPEAGFLQEIDLIRLTSHVFGGGCVLMILWKAYVEYWRK
jgi:hypothetical protein